MRPSPLIAVTGPVSRAPVAYWATAFSLALHGARAVRLTARNFQLHEKEKFHGIVIGGGSDIDPGLYGQGSDEISPMDPERDAFEVEMIEHALRTHLPILGICRGAQLINVVLGGSLFGDIRGMRTHTSNRRNPLPAKYANLLAEGRLSAIIEKTRWPINSLHSQAVDGLGRGLKRVAEDDDRITQAIESVDQRFILGVQWHPEYLFYLAAQRRLFGALVTAASIGVPEEVI